MDGGNIPSQEIDPRFDSASHGDAGNDGGGQPALRRATAWNRLISADSIFVKTGSS